jgi:formamidase
MKSVKIDRSKRLWQQPETGHNRWHPDIPPILDADPGEEVLLETRDARDGQIHAGTTLEDLPKQDKKSGHPLTGPIFVKGAQPGDLLEIEYLDIVPQPYGWTRFYKGAGFLHDAFDKPFLAHWTLTDRWATSREIPGVRIPEASFMGTAGLAPSHAQLREWTRREADLDARGGRVHTPDALDAVPRAEPIASEGLRTTPPRENCGNLDAKQLTRGSKLFIPVNVAGGLYSTGDAHFAQGDGEVCVSAIEMGATVTVRFQVHAQKAARDNIRWPRFSHPGYFAAPEWAVPRGFIATVGMPLREDGTQESGDITLAARNALLEMIRLLQERGFSREQAYVICSVAVDLRISNAVNYPNLAVSALLPEAIFAS